jgi:hypothetical protein
MREVSEKSVHDLVE